MAISRADVLSYLEEANMIEVNIKIPTTKQINFFIDFLPK